jgi:hypothetical protein
MTNCPKCGKEIAKGASICKHCHIIIGVPQRLAGVKIIGILVLIFSIATLGGLYLMPGLTIFRRFGWVWSATILQSGIGIFSSIVLFLQKRIALNMYIVYTLFTGLVIIGSGFYTFARFTSPFFDVKSYLIDIVFSISLQIFEIVFTAWSLRYLLQHKDYFTNY